MAGDIQDLLERTLRDVYAPSNLADRVIAGHGRRRFRRRVATGLGAAVFAAAAAALIWVAVDPTSQAGPAAIGPAASATPSPPASPSSRLIPAAQRQRAPELAGTTIFGKTFSDPLSRRSVTADAAGHISVVNFCSSSSAPCRQEQKVFDPLEPGAAAVPGAQLIGVDEHDTLPNVRAYVQQVGVKYPVLFDDGSLAQAWGASSAVPVTFLIDPEGRIAARFDGVVSRDALFAVIKVLTFESPTASSSKTTPATAKPFAASSQPTSADSSAEARKKAAASAAAKQPETSKGTVPSLPQAKPAQTPATKTAPPVKP